MNQSHGFMLWKKSWLETRLLLPIYMGLVLVAAVGFLWSGQLDLAKWASELQKDAPRWSEDSRRLLPLLNSYQGYVWSHWFKLMLPLMWPIGAVVLGGTIGAVGLFTFSLPVSRRRVLLTQAALVAIEVVLIALVPSLMFPIASRLIGGTVPFGSTMVYALLLSLGGMVFPAFSFLLMALFYNPQQSNNYQRSYESALLKVWGIGIAVVFALFFPPFVKVGTFRIVEEYPWWNVYHVMSGETYFRYGQIPWLGLFACLAVSALMMFAAVRIYERRDF
jgi:hypothetical protein